MATKLVYNGSVTTSFVAVGSEVNPGDEFMVPDEMAESFLQRPDVDPAADHSTAESDTPPKTTPKKSVQPKPEPEPTAEEPEAK